MRCDCYGGDPELRFDPGQSVHTNVAQISAVVAAFSRVGWFLSDFCAGFTRGLRVLLSLTLCACSDSSAIKIKKGVNNSTKFKIRCARYLYTLVVPDKAKADKVFQSLPPGTFICFASRCVCVCLLSLPAVIAATFLCVFHLRITRVRLRFPLTCSLAQD